MAKGRRSAAAAKTVDTKKTNGILIAIIVITLLIGIAVLVKILTTPKEKTAVDNGTPTQQQNNDTTTQEDQKQSDTPEYEDGSIALNKKAPMGITFTRSYRDCYYKMGNTLSTLFPEDKLEAAMDAVYKFKEGQEPDVMLLAALLEYFGIPKEQFEAALEKEREYCQKFGLDTTNEEYEIPNADIIYTFEEDIIKHYYRRS